ncbi:hypothetical protein [Methylobacterium nigriterrae]|uniref:hypothetical protein n=1 Tax=Methylobacterium nigriterrae TaxID=3127512 RepID=UPI00301352AC
MSRIDMEMDRKIDVGTDPRWDLDRWWDRLVLAALFFAVGLTVGLGGTMAMNAVWPLERMAF